MGKNVMLLLFLLFFLQLNAQKASQPLQIVPAVQSWKPQQGEFILKETARICVSVNDYSKISEQLNLFRSDLKTLFTGAMLIVTDKPKRGDLVFKILDLRQKSPEAYKISIGEKVVVEANDYHGIFYATQTLLQMFILNKTEKSLSKGVIEDYPKYKVRSMMLDVGRKYFPLEVLKQYIRSMAYLKYSQLHLHFNDDSGDEYFAFRIESKAFPELTAKDGFYTQKEIRDLQNYASQLGITIIPEFDSPGHSHCFTNLNPTLQHPVLGSNYLDITNPETYKLMEKIFDEFIPLFQAEDIHIGTDEYRLRKIKDKNEAQILGEKFREYINRFNSYVRSKGKKTRIWSGYEYMPGTTEPDTSIVIDMWETSDAKAKSLAGYKMINSSHFWTYIVPAAPYYGVNNTFIYEKWSPALFNDEKPENNLSEDDPHLLGGKFHVWLDFGPSGYTMNEIARLVMPSLWAFSEKLWGTKGSANYADFVKRYQTIQSIPGVNFTERRILSDENGIVYSSKDAVFVLNSQNEFINLPFGATDKNVNLEYPWTLDLEVCRTDTLKRATILSSESAEIFANDVFKTKSTKTKADTILTGFAFDRAMHYTKIPVSATNSSHYRNVFNYSLPLNKFVKITLVGDEEKTTLYVNGIKQGSFGVQMLCPLNAIGSSRGESFTGTVKNIRIYNRMLSDDEIKKKDL